MRFRSYWPLLTAIGIGVVARVLVALAVFPAVYYSRDMLRYARVWPRRLLEDWWMPVGYPFFLWVLRDISPRVALVTCLQHLLGVASGVLVFAIARALNAPRRVAALIALPAMVSGDLLFIEHAIATETLFSFMMMSALLLAVYGITRRSFTFFALASCLIAMTTLVRSIGLLLIGAVVVGAAVALWPSRRLLMISIVAAVVPAITLVEAYKYYANAVGGYAGISDMGGWDLYERVATFADCRRFTPPEGSQLLCEERPAAQRPGTFFYASSPLAPSLKYFSRPGAVLSFFALDREKDGMAKEFALAAMTHQPIDYLYVVGRDAGRYFAPGLDRRQWAGPGPDFYDFRGSRGESERWLQETLSDRYRDTPLHRRPALLNAVARYASTVRFNGWVLAIAILSSVAGMVRTRDRNLRATLLMLTSAAAVLYALPVVMVTYDYRYGFPPQIPLSCAAGLGIWILVRRWIDQRSPRPASRPTLERAAQPAPEMETEARRR